MSYFFELDQYGDLKKLHVVRIIVSIVLIVIALNLVFGSWSVVQPGERGVRILLGNIRGVENPGFHFKVPFIEDMVKMDVRTKAVKYELEDPLFAASKDLQDVKISALVNYHIDPVKVGAIYQQYGSVESYEAGMIRPKVRDIVKSIASRYTAEELVTKRADYNTAVYIGLTDQLTQFDVVIESVNITNFEFSPSFTQSIEAKVTAEQEALTVKNQLERTKYQAEQTVVQAQANADSVLIAATAEAEAIRIKSQAITVQGGAEYVKLKAIEKWQGEVPTHMIPNATVPFIDVN